MATLTQEQIRTVLSGLHFNQAYVFPLVNDTGNHYKFYNMQVRMMSQRTTPNWSRRYTIVYTWGKIDTHGRTNAKKPYPLDEEDALLEIYDVFSKKRKKGYKLVSDKEYSVISERSRAYTLSLNSTAKASKLKKKSSSKKTKDATSIRFDDLII